MEFKSILGKRINELRKKNKLSQKEFCDKIYIDLTRESLSNIEKGKQLPSSEFIKAVVEAFNISPYWLLDIKPAAITDKILRYELLNDNDKEALYNYIEFLLDMNNKMNP